MGGPASHFQFHLAEYLKKHQEDDAQYRDVEEDELSDFDDESENHNKATEYSEEFDSFSVRQMKKKERIFSL